VVAELGRGGMGVVYRARQTKLDRVVALKMILAGAHAGADDLARFKTEAEAIARLQHPNIVQVFEVGEHGGLPYFSLEFCGGSLDKKLAGTPLPPKEAAAIVGTLAQAMQAAHDRGVVHRDLKPANVLLAEDGTPKITDFGLAKKLDEAGRTATGAVMGTPSYMAPEQAGGKRGQVGPAADVYALGAILYECLTGRPPFKAATSLDTILQVISDEPVPPRQLQLRTPRDLETVCLKCLRKDPKKRYASAEALAEDLRRFQAGESIQARPVGRVERTVKWVRRNPAAAALVATLLVGTAVAAFFAIRANQKAAEALEQKGRADEQTELAKGNARVANERAYISDLRLVQRAWEENDIDLVQQLLDVQRPEKTDGEDLRGFEWHHWWRQSHDRGLQTFQGETDQVLSVAFSPDGRRLASGSLDGTVKVWDTATGQAKQTLHGHNGLVSGVAFSPDGKRLASCGGTPYETGEVKVWDLATGREALTLRGHRGLVNSVAFSPDGKRLASASWDGTVRVWDAATGKETLTLKQESAVLSVAFSADGKYLACGSLHGTPKVWDTVTGRQAFVLQGRTTSWIKGVVFSPDGKRLASLASENVMVWNLATRQVVQTLRGHNDSAVGVVFSPDGRHLASGGSMNSRRGSEVTVWDMATGQEVLTLRGHSDEVLAVAFSPDGRRLASGGGKRYFPGELRIWDAATGQGPLTLAGHRSHIQGIAFSPDGRLASCGSTDHTVRVWDGVTGEELLTLRGRFHPEGVAFSPDGRRLASGASERSNLVSSEGEVTVWDAATGRETLTLRGHTKKVHSVAFSPNGKRLASASADMTVRMWDAVTGEEERTFKGHTAPVWGVAFSPDGQRLASASDDRTVRVWDAATGQEAFILKELGSVARGVAFSPDGRRLASGSGSAIKVWDAATGQEERTLLGHGSQVYGVSFSPDSKRLASASADKTVKVWDVASGQETLTLRGHSSGVSSIAFSPDGKRLVSASGDGAIKVWDTAELTPESQAAHLAQLEKQGPGWHLEEAKRAFLERIMRGPEDAAPGVPLGEIKLGDILGRDFALQFHLKYVDGAKSEAPPFYIRRGEFYLSLDQTNKALADFSRVIEMLPHDAGAWRDRAKVYIRLSQWPQAVADFSRAIELTPRDGESWSERASAHIQLRQWDQAEADLAKAVELAPEDRRGWYKLARVRLAVRKAEGYQSACAALLQRFDKPTDILPAEDVVWTCLLAPNSGANPAQLLQLADTLVAELPKGFSPLNATRARAILKTLGAALYRAGKYDAAVQRLNEAIATQSRGEHGIDWLFLAMAQHRLGRQDAARKSFAKAVSLHDEQGIAALTWESRLEWDIVRKEAEALIQPKGP
jgi:WD40 repeat protein/tetratricopeptide (TPR) repeat protein